MTASKPLKLNCRVYDRLWQRLQAEHARLAWEICTWRAEANTRKADAALQTVEAREADATDWTEEAKRYRRKYLRLVSGAE